MNEKRKMKTDSIHGGDHHNPTSSVSMPIFQSSTYKFDNSEEIELATASEAPDKFYGRHASPNTKQVEAIIAKLEGGERAISVASGLAAASLILLSNLKGGDHIVAQKKLYPTIAKLISSKLPDFGIEVSLVDHTKSANFLSAIRPNTKMIYIESPVNPLMTLTDISAVSKISADQGIMTVVDNTFATPFNQRPITLGADIVLHSATKYLSGHSDVLAGVVVAKSSMITKLWTNHIMFGGTLHPAEAWLLQRGLQTFPLRMKQHNLNAKQVAEFLLANSKVEQVFYPGLPSHPQYDLAKRQMKGGFGGMIAFTLKKGDDAAKKLLGQLKMIEIAVSLGGTHSLITHPGSTILPVFGKRQVDKDNLPESLMRLSVGLESVEDIIEDLDHALT